MAMRAVARAAWRTGWLLGGALLTAGAQAQADEGPYVAASLQWQHDSNLFRLPAGVDPQLVIGRDSAAETVGVRSLSVGFDKRYSLQQVRAEASLVGYAYQRFPRYDLLARNYRLNWDWAYTPELRGRLYGEQQESVNSFDDTQSLTGENRSVRRQHGLELRYGQDGAWQLQGALHRSLDDSDQSQFGQNGYRQITVEGGVQRRFASGNRATLRLRRNSGQNLDVSPGVDDYRQSDLVLDLHWKAGGKTEVDAQLAQVWRSHPAGPSMDFSGHNASLSLTWQASGKTALTVSGATELSAYQTVASTHARNDRLGLTGVWSVGAQTTVNGSLSETRRRLLGQPGTLATDPRRDRTREATLALNWSFDRRWNLQSSLARRTRASTQTGADFASTQATLGLSARY